MIEGIVNQRPEKFTGVGTVLMTDIFNWNLDHECGPEDMVEFLNSYLSQVTTTIQKHSGVISECVGDVVLGLWHPCHQHPNHAQLAFDAAREILTSLPEFMSGQKIVTYDVEIVLGTGRMAGDFFGPTKQYQIVGAAMSIATRLSKARDRRGTCIRMSQYTVDFVHPKDSLQETGTIKRDNLEDLKIFTHYLANPAVQPTATSGDSADGCG